MKHFIPLLLAVIAVTACGTARQVPASQTPSSSWIGCSTSEILEAMGNPNRIDGDGRDGSILVYESAPDYDDPGYDIFDPQASARTRRYAKFYLDREGVCYFVDTNRDLPSAPRADGIESVLVSGLDILFDLAIFPLLVIGLFL